MLPVLIVGAGLLLMAHARGQGVAATSAASSAKVAANTGNAQAPSPALVQSAVTSAEVGAINDLSSSLSDWITGATDTSSGP